VSYLHASCQSRSHEVWSILSNPKVAILPLTEEGSQHPVKARASVDVRASTLRP
jgi:hypothetical protein